MAAAGGTAVRAMGNDALIVKWNKFSKAYSAVMEQWSWPSYASLVSATGLPVLDGSGLASWKHLDAAKAPSSSGKRPPLVLDVGCGPGSHSLELARMHPGLRILATDLSEGMIELARSRAAGVDNIAFAVASADSEEVAARGLATVAAGSVLAGEHVSDPMSEALRVPGGEGALLADAAIANLVMQIVPDTLAAFQGVGASLRPGAPFAFAVWGDRSRSALFTALPGALRSLEISGLEAMQAEVAEAAATTRSGFHLEADVPRVKRLLAEAGFGPVSTWTTELPMPGGPVLSAQDGAARLIDLIPANSELAARVHKEGGDEARAALTRALEGRVQALMDEDAVLGLHVRVYVAAKRG
ncbi:hypothetical protein FNF27_01053 [Cafeteria roenbergensis]|uniref:Methyltransferase domain-containing protein n=1 Tax=Cafeteria roenbergensis TaxID=33653 RepID=A0A5A8EJ34_CAFRO|nr:hypothetical protein FNF27_01053 [Cafeteria roenbergensis]